jgi:hypothetical protein
LDLTLTQVTDVGLKELAGLTDLQTLNLDVNRITDAGLKELAALTSLQTLDLNTTQVTNQGLKELARLKNLKTLNLGFTKVTDAGLKELAAQGPRIKSHPNYCEEVDRDKERCVGFEATGPRRTQGGNAWLLPPSLSCAASLA